MHTLVELLNVSHADAWELIERENQGWEFYFIKHALDQNRVRNTKTIDIKVYCQLEEGFIGSASGCFSPSLSKEEYEKEIAQLIENAKLVKNPYFKLNEPKEGKKQDNGAVDVSMIAKDFIETMQEVEETKTEDLNSYEIFVDEVRVHYQNSNGVDVESVYPSSMLEVVVNARKEDHEIELYRMYHSGTCDKQSIKEELANTMRYGKDKLIAKDTPALQKADVLFTTSAAIDLYDDFIDQMSGAMKYRQISNAEKGKPIIEGASGDVFTIKAVPSLPNSSMNQAYDAEGAPIYERVLIEKNIAKNFIGSRQFCYYIQEEDTFIPGNYEVSGGSKKEEELREGNYLEVVEFSDFQVDTFNGDMAGEIRLAYWHHDGEVEVVSGGSISGNLRELAKNMFASEKQKQYNNYKIPALTRLNDVIVTGITRNEED
ncbi:MAG: TldD/PmbA family protein [Solobacterium sp.]|nr:TldD/PmbA family protein [Solobacterium sp.]